MLTVSILALVSIGCAEAKPRAPRAADGVLDLRAWDFGREGPVRLSGEWDFFPGVLLGGRAALSAPRVGGRRVPDQWHSGIVGGTYRLTVLLPTVRPALGIRYTTVSTAFELDADGLTIAEAGRPSMDPSTEIPAYKPGVAALAGSGDRLVLVARVSNHVYRVGGMWRAFSLGPKAALDLGQLESVGNALTLAASLAVLAVVFSFFIRTEESGLGFAAFSAFTLAAALRALVTGNYPIVDIVRGLRFDTLIRLEYLSVFTIFPLGFLFFWVLFPAELGRRAGRTVLAACSAFLLLLPFAPLRVLTWSILPYYFLALIVIGATALILIRALARRRAESLPLALSAGVLAVTAVNDMLFSSFFVNTANLFPLGVLISIGIQAYALSERYRSMQRRLRQTLAEKDMLIHEVHHRVKNSLQIMSSIVSLQSHRSSEPAALAAYASMRDRIRAISLVHEKLYSLGSGDEIDLEVYARDLAAQLSGSFGSPLGGLVCEAESLLAPAELCIDLGLVMTELVSNAYKHASGSGGEGSVRVRIAADEGGILLSVKDEGPGFPEGWDMQRAGGLGFRLISALVKKRDGAIFTNRGPGAWVRVRFPLHREKTMTK